MPTSGNGHWGWQSVWQELNEFVHRLAESGAEGDEGK